MVCGDTLRLEGLFAEVFAGLFAGLYAVCGQSSQVLFPCDECEYKYVTH